MTVQAVQRLMSHQGETRARMPSERKKLIQWQRPMVVMYQAMGASALGAAYLFGWRVLAVLGVACLTAFVVERIFCHGRGKPVTSAAFVTAGLLALSLPPTTPLWMVAVGAVVAIMFAKEVFGGFGRNVFNPAMTGRCFLYVCFPNALTGHVWLSPASGFPGGLARWTTDALTGATPLDSVKRLAGDVDLLDALLGRTGGSLGATPAILLILAGVYLVYRRSADWRSMVGAVLGALVFSAVFHFSGVKGAISPLATIMAGGFMFAAVYMVTDPVSSGQNRETHFLGAFLVGALTVVLRTFGTFPEGVMFAVLMVNMFTPLLDYLVREWKKSKKASAKAAQSAAS